MEVVLFADEGFNGGVFNGQRSAASDLGGDQLDSAILYPLGELASRQMPAQLRSS
jgi:hypothetical protein